MSHDHDPLCPYREWYCQCHLIAKVRQDQCSLCCTKSEAAIAAAFQSGMDQMIDGIEQVSYDKGQRDERLASFKRLMSIPTVQCHPENPNIKMIEQEEAACAVVDMLPCGTAGYRHPYDAYERGQRDMLAKCIAAAKATDPRWSVDYRDAIRDIVAALEALQEKP